MRAYILRDLSDSFTQLTRPFMPYSLDVLEKMPHMHALASSVRELTHSLKTIRDKILENKESFLNEQIDFFVNRIENPNLPRFMC